jgi:uncharacterized Zn finger protein (UPF0148 family)
MSDFDKEAEREKLREKYERDSNEREATERMSELLLQGATMTNAHCSECSDPIFRYDGQEFCATCERAVERNTGDADTSESDDTDGSTAADQSSGGIEVTSPDDTQVQFGGDVEQDQPSTGDTEQPDATDTASSGNGAEPTSADRDTPETAGAESADAGRTAPADSTASDDSRPPERADGTDAYRDLDDRAPRRESPTGGSTRQSPTDGDVATAEASLVRSLVRFSERAEATEDPRQARDELSAAREAAEALAALRR